MMKMAIRDPHARAVRQAHGVSRRVGDFHMVKPDAVAAVAVDRAAIAGSAETAGSTWGVGRRKRQMAQRDVSQGLVLLTVQFDDRSMQGATTVAWFMFSSCNGQ